MISLPFGALAPFLPDAAIEELLVTVLGGPVDTASLRQLADHCRDNPMVLRELVTGALESARWAPTAASGGCGVSCGSPPAWSSWSRCG